MITYETLLLAAGCISIGILIGMWLAKKVLNGNKDGTTSNSSKNKKDFKWVEDPHRQGIYHLQDNKRNCVYLISSKVKKDPSQLFGDTVPENLCITTFRWKQYCKDEDPTSYQQYRNDKAKFKK